MSVRYVTVAELQGAKAAMIRTMPGLVIPAVYAVGYRNSRGQLEFPTVNGDGAHEFPAVVLAKVLGYREGSASFRLSLATFDQAIALLEPAGACAAYQHPNLWAWQQLRLEIALGAHGDNVEIVAVFLGEDHPDPGDEGCAALRAAING